MNTSSNSPLGILAGIVGTIIAAAILYPLAWLVFDQFFEINFGRRREGEWKNELILGVTVSLWIFLSCLTGAYICGRISKAHEYRNASFILLTWLSLMMYFFITEDGGRSDLKWLIMIIGLSVLGIFVGCRLAMRYKYKRNPN